LLVSELEVLKWLQTWSVIKCGKVDQEIKYRKELEDMSIPPFPILVNSHFTQ
jgi:hypothetical protein